MIHIPEGALEICRELRARGRQAWLVGGAVRDLFLGRQPHDWDIATDARPAELVGVFDHVVLVGEKHGTVAVIRDGESYEVTTFRGEGEYVDGRRPESVVFVDTIERDLSRRDFTVNAIAWDPISGVYADPFNGGDDIRGKVIRCVGDPLARFGEDGLRALRACRFAATLEMGWVPSLAPAIAASLDTYRKVAVERVHDEWLKAMAAPRPSVAFDLMLSTGILGATSPEMLPMVGCTQNRYHGFDVWRHTMAVLDAAPAGDPELRIAALFHDIGKPVTKGTNLKTGQATFYDHEVVGTEMAQGILTRLKFSSASVERICHLIRHHLVRYEPGDSKATIRRWARKVGLDNVPSILALARADVAGKGDAEVQRDTSAIDELESRLAAMQVSEVIPTSAASLAINGRDVMERLDIVAGPRIGECLRMLLEIVTDDPSTNTREILLGKLDEMNKVQ